HDALPISPGSAGSSDRRPRGSCPSSWCPPCRSENSSPPTGEELRSPGPLPRPCSPGDDTTLEPPTRLGDGDNSPCSSPSVLKGFTPGQNRVGASHGVWTERDPPAAGRRAGGVPAHAAGPRTRNGCEALLAQNAEPGTQPWFDVVSCCSACCSSSLPFCSRPFTRSASPAPMNVPQSSRYES